jgi:two-component system, NtrC family, sensor kinase
MVQFFAFNGLVNFIAVIIVCYYIILYHRHERIFLVSLFMALAVGLWSFGYWRTFSSFNYEDAILTTRILGIGSTLIPLAFLSWVIIFFDKAREHKKILLFSYLVTLVFLVFGFSGFFIKSVAPVGYFPFWPQPGILYHFYIFISYIGFIGYGLFLLWVYGYKKEAGFMRRRFLYILIGLSLCALGGLTNFPAWYGFPIPPFGNILTTLFSIVCAYAVMYYNNYKSDCRLLRWV